MKILFVHQNFPGQYKHLAAALGADPAHKVHALSISERAVPPGVRRHIYAPRRGSTPGLAPLAADFEAKAIRGEACAHAAQALKDRGFAPDVILAHPGWGESLFLKDVWPAAKVVSFVEFHYAAGGGDVTFDNEFVVDTLADRMRVRAKNAANLLALEGSDAAVSPTAFQRSTVPPAFRPLVRVIHDGIDTDAMRPDPGATITLGRAGVLRPGDEVVTFVNRNLEPYRGYHVFMRALPRLLAARPKARVVIVGGDGVSYGKAPPAGRTWKETYLAEVRDRLDMERVHFVGTVPYDTFRSLLQVSAAHVYLTYPFVLSWSMLEAMACGALVIGSRTAPVEEVIEDGVNGRLVEFFDPDGIADTVADSLARGDAMAPLRAAARAHMVERYDLRRVCLPRQMALIEEVLG